MASLAWNIAAWRLSGPRVRVRTHVNLDDGELLLGAYIWNKGRAPIDIAEAVVHRDGTSAESLLPSLGIEEPGLPFRLSQGSSVVLETSFLPPGPYVRAAWCQTVVTLANGDISRSNRERNPATP